MRKLWKVAHFNILFAWLMLNLFSTAAFFTIAIREISLREYPKHDPFIYSVLVDPYLDLFLPMIKGPMVTYGVFTGLILFLVTRSFWEQRPKSSRHLVLAISLLLTIVFFWIGVLLVNWMAENLECELLGGTLFGCWELPSLQLWHTMIGILGTAGIVSFGYFWGKGLPILKGDGQ